MTKAHSHYPWKRCLHAIEAALTNGKYRLQRSFDLQMARAQLADPSACPCPHHGTPECTCQYIVLQLYEEERLMGTLVVHSSNR